jgi:transposase
LSRAGWTPRGVHNRIEEPTMAKVRSWVGLDVHARWVLAAIIDGESGELCTCRLSGNTSEVVEFCCSLPGPTRVAYEAGPTGYGLVRALHKAGVGCVVAAPGKIERPAADKVKTDQRDAENVDPTNGENVTTMKNRVS